MITRLALGSHRTQERKVSMKIRTSRKGGFTLVEIMIVVAIIGLLAAIAIPNFVKARVTAQTTGCINNLRQIDGAIQTYALEAHVAPDAGITLDNLKPYIKLDSNGDIPHCPAGGTYSVTTVNANPTCSVMGHKLP
jgi:prepilin-type N-terminal cleavage/methylation domain-containing protein